jgi:general secretion pathway protein C
MSGEIKYRIILSTTHLLLFTAMAYLGVSMFYNILARGMILPLNTESLNIEPLDVPQPPKTYPLSHYKMIIERNLFKTKKEGVKQEKSISFEKLNSTELELNLWGTIIGKGSKSYAVIEDLSGNQNKTMQQLYHVGDSVQGAIIKKILDEKVVLNLNGKNEILEMEEFRSRIRGSRRYRSPRRSVRQSRITLRRSQIENAMGNLNTLMKQILVTPHRDGIRIRRIKPRSIFRKMGLRNGDIITGIDGKPIESVDSALRIYEELQSSSRVSLQLKRRGRERTIDYYIR